MLSSFVTFFAKRSGLTLVLWIGLVVFGVMSYTTWLQREGFPGVDAPITLANGTYFVNDIEKVDGEVLQPLTKAAMATDEVVAITTVARENSFTLIAELDESYTSAQGAAAIDEAAGGAGLPEALMLVVSPVDVARFLDEYDLLVGVYGDENTTAEELEAAAATLLPVFDDRSAIDRAEVVELIQRGVNPETGQEVADEGSFNELTPPGSDNLSIRPSIAVGVVANEGIDSLGIRDATDVVLADAADQEVLPDRFEAIVAIDAATQIRQQIGSLQSNVFTGVIAVAVVALLLISWRASIITAFFIFTVMATTFGVLYLVGISLNTISLFGVIIALGLFVDDAIVITEAIDAFREGGQSAIAIIGHAIKRVGAASVSGTITTVLVFAPMLAISGILGDFIRILPISVIVALVTSLLLSLVFIPFASRFLILSATESRGLLSRAVDKAANFISKLAGTTGDRGVVVAVAGVFVSLAMTGVGLFVFAPQVGFNIFPPQKDSEFLNVEYSFEPGTTIDEAKAITSSLNQSAIDALDGEAQQVYTYIGNSRAAFTQIRLSPLGGRTAAPKLVDEVLEPLAADVRGARAVFSMQSAGPPELLFPFQVQIFGENPELIIAAAEEIQLALDNAAIERPNGTTFNVVETDIALTDTISRVDGRRYVEVRARFDADDVTTTTAETQSFVEERFDSEELEALGLGSDALGFDFGFESDNQESFSSMPQAFGIALLLMLVLLIIQFRSSIQWLLVFLAIPFSFFGVFGGLLLTDNQISFFVMLGLLGLIGIAVNNTILLTDFANQERAGGADRKTAIETAMRRRFRPLVATSLTTVAGVLPLALSDPFWEALGFTIIFGLLSSTFLVLVSFPYYYLAFEWLRDQFVTPWRRQVVDSANQTI